MIQSTDYRIKDPRFSRKSAKDRLQNTKKNTVYRTCYSGTGFRKVFAEYGIKKKNLEHKTL